jgi:hypothetical protein
MTSLRALFVIGAVLALIPRNLTAQVQKWPSVPLPTQSSLINAAPAASRTTITLARPTNLIAAITLADIGFINGFRFANLGGRREVFVPLPQGSEVTSSELVLVIDDISAHEARRNLEVLVNDRSTVAIALDGKSQGRTIRVPLVKAKDGFLKLSFLYSGAATPDRCIDVRYVGDSLTIRPETAIEMDVGATKALDVATTAALLPREVAIVLPGRRLATSEIVTALTVGRTLIASGHRIRFQHGYDSLPEFGKRNDSKRWTRGIVLIGSFEEVSGLLDAPVAIVAGPPVIGAVAAVRVGGAPALFVSDATAGRLLASPWLMATRGVVVASVGETVPWKLSSDRMTFDQLGVAPAQAEVFGRADLSVAIDIRRLPTGTRASRLVLDLMVAPDGAGEKAVVSAYVNERLLNSTVAATNEQTRLDLLIPEGLIGTSANIRVVVQRRSAQGDCRFEPQGYPAQILGSSAFIIAAADVRVNDFSDLATRWAAGLEILLPAFAADRPTHVFGLVASVLSALSPETAPITVKLLASGAAPAPTASFIAVSDLPPTGGTPRVRFDRGRIVVGDRSGNTLLDLGGFSAGAVAQVVTVGDFPGLWIRSLGSDGALPEPSDLKLDHGDVAFLDGIGVALTMSTERDTLIRINYPEQVSWLTIAERMRFWIIGGLWLLATAILLFALQRMFRRRTATGADE